MEAGHSPAQNLPCASKSHVGRPFPTHILKNIQGQILFYPTPAFFWVCTGLTVLRPASLGVHSAMPIHSGKPFQHLSPPRAHPCPHPLTRPIQGPGEV